MKLDWQHVALAVVGLGCATACILLGHGSIVLQVLAGVGGVAGVGSLLKGSPVAGDKPTGDKPKDGAP